MPDIVSKPSGRYPVPACDAASPCTSELCVRKSLFVTRTCLCASAEDAKNFIMELRKSHPDATHHCWAFLAGPPGDSSRVGFSDDGEPHGTAGRPMLNLLLHSGIGDICAVVSRWFGGIKLGTGGLVRAYQDSLRENLLILPLRENIPSSAWKADVEYGSLESARRCLDALEARILTEEYGALVEINFVLPREREGAMREALANVTRGGVRLEAVDEGKDLS